MPRKAKPQQARVPSGQDYGERQDQMTAQQQMPLPDMKAAPPAATGPSGGAPAADPMAAALAMEPPAPPPWAGGPMGESITEGIPSGPGPGPEILDMSRVRQRSLRDLLIDMADVTGNPFYIEAAQDAP